MHAWKQSPGLAGDTKSKETSYICTCDNPSLTPAPALHTAVPLVSPPHLRQLVPLCASVPARSQHPSVLLMQLLRCALKQNFFLLKQKKKIFGRLKLDASYTLHSRSWGNLCNSKHRAPNCKRTNTNLQDFFSERSKNLRPAKLKKPL